jgi:hypothetical protein
MSLLNVISVPTSSGIKTIEIHNNDLTLLNFKCDILVISAYRKSYRTASKSVIKSLEVNNGINLEEVAQIPLLDFRNSLHSWISRPLLNQSFKHILCVEGIKNSINATGSSEIAISDMFGTLAILPHKGISINTIAMPLLGAGIQGNSIKQVLPNLIQLSISALNNIPSLSTIFFIEKDAEKAREIDTTINMAMRRPQDSLELVFDDNKLIELLDEILAKLILIKQQYKKQKQSNTIEGLIDKITSRQLRSFELGILSRKLLELLLPEIVDIDGEKSNSLYEQIGDLKSKGIEQWMITYMHTIRIFGNHVAHADKTESLHFSMERIDMRFLAIAVIRFLDLYLSVKHVKEPTSISVL